MTAVARSLSVRQARNLHIDLTPYTTTTAISSNDDRPSSSSARLGAGTRAQSQESSSSARNSRNIQFSVLCLHDYDSVEENGLSFRKNEILQILEQEPTGWWAARRKGTKEIGWIPKAYVAKLSSELVERYEKMREEIRSYEHDAERLYTEAPVSKLNLVDSDSEPTPSGSVSRSSSAKAQKPSTSSVAPAATRRPPPVDVSDEGSQDRAFIKEELSNPRAQSQAQPPPSPTSPMPHPPQSSPVYNQFKPNPPLALDRARAGSLSNRSLRRRPLIVADNAALSRLSTLIETKNTREIDKYANPDITGSLHALSSRARPDQPRRPSNTTAAKERSLQTSFHVLHKPWYILPGHADELELDKDGQVRAGSLRALVERLTSNAAFVDPQQPNAEHSFASAFLMTFRTFTTSDELFDLLLDRFSMTRPDGLVDVEVDDWKKRYLQPTQRHVLAIFTLWLEEHRLLEDDRHIAQRLPDFATKVAMPLFGPESQALLQTFEKLTFLGSPTHPVGLTPKKPRKTKPHKNDLMRIDPSLLAEQLTLYEYTRYSKITPRECLAYMHSQTSTSVSNLSGFCRTYEELAGWVKLSILNGDAIAKRANTIEYWIKVAERCKVLHNYYSMSAILTSLTSTVITRLALTWVHVGRKAQLDALAKFNEPSGNFAAYRGLLAAVEGNTPCVPFITMYLTDLVRIKEQFHDQPGRICFQQRQRWYETITTLLKFQRRPYFILIDDHVTAFMHNHLQDGIKDPAWFWSKSQDIHDTELAHADIRKGLDMAGF